MSHLTFPGFLTIYVRSLSVQKTNALRKLALEIDTQSPRLQEPLVLFACFSKDRTSALRQFVETKAFDAYKSLNAEYPSTESLMKYLSEKTSTPDNFQKVYLAYLATLNVSIMNRKSKEGMRNRLLYVQRKHNITPYQVCKQFSLNTGNYYSFLRGNMKPYSIDFLMSLEEKIVKMATEHKT